MELVVSLGYVEDYNMSKIHITEIKQGDVLGEDIKTDKGMILFSKDHVFEVSDIPKLMDHGIFEIELATEKKSIDEVPHKQKELFKKYQSSSKEELIKKMKEEAVQRFGPTLKNPVMKEIMRLSIKYRLKMHKVLE